MPIVNFKGVTDTGEPVEFEREGGCLCILGKDSDEIGSIRDFKRLSRMEKITSFEVDFDLSIYSEHRELYEYLQSIYSCSCTADQSFGEFKNASGVMAFDASQSLNECMHWMFVVRTFFGHYASVQRKDTYGRRGVTFIEHREKGFSLQESFVLSLLPSLSNLNAAMPDLSNNMADENLFNYRKVSWDRLIQISEGKFAPEYNPRTLDQNITSGYNYSQNITQLAEDLPRYPPRDHWMFKIGEQCRILRGTDSSTTSSLGLSPVMTIDTDSFLDGFFPAAKSLGLRMPESATVARTEAA